MDTVELLAMGHHHYSGMAVCLKPKVSFVITETLVDEMRAIQNQVVDRYYSNPWDGVYYLIWYLFAGKTPWKGMDFDYIYNSFLNNQEKKVEKYVGDIFDILFLNYIGLGLPVLTCSIAHRATSGISNEFFLLNRINFIKRRKPILNKNGPHVKKVDLVLDKTKGHFPPEIYSRNQFYKLDIVNINSMKDAINEFKFIPIMESELTEIRLHFDAIKHQTISRIYEVASKDINILRRFSELQSSEHRGWLSR